MKKTSKLFAVILTLAMLFCSVTAHAAEAEKTIEWGEYCGDCGDIVALDIYPYGGALKEGANPVSMQETTLCFTFDASREGYYRFSAEDIRLIFPAWFSDSMPVDEATVLHSEDEENGDILIYLEKGMTYVACELGEDNKNPQIDIEFFDVETADIEFAEGTFDNLVLGGDCFYLNGAESSVLEMKTSAQVVFENGESFSVKEGSFECTFEELKLNGEPVEAAVSFNGYSEKQSMTVALPMYYIQKIEISNLEDYLDTVIYYDGSFVSAYEDGLHYETMTVTYSDGTTEIVESIDTYREFLHFPNGRRYRMDIFEEISEDGAEFVLNVAGQNLLVKECRVRNATVGENLEKLTKYVSLQIRRIENSSDEFAEAMTSGEGMIIEELAARLESYAGTLKTHMGYIAEEVAEFCGYYFSIK